MQLLHHYFVLLTILIQVIPTNSLQCWGYSDYEYAGSIQNSDKVQMTCTGNYCMTLSEQGSDFNVYNGTCPDKSVAITDCESNGVGCQNEKIGTTYIKVCCCNYDLCNTSRTTFYVLSVILMATFYLLR
ncbi:hypothetical protein CAEBREN_01620 [Caenorhabditis brenneri]|uniref:UPAR/Ly6 domain-containing protein n=1 Tax=Caenorhabditis brenneri TaxID=135651 RepID=G0N7T1_CAEBE|nr:hypothetical protein CAEBREN_01620 [Caenorhabditis brenneri]